MRLGPLENVSVQFSDSLNMGKCTKAHRGLVDRIGVEPSPGLGHLGTTPGVDLQFRTNGSQPLNDS